LLTDRKSQDYSISGSRAFFGVEKSVAMQLFSSIKKGKKMENVRLPVWYAGRFMQVGRTRIAVISSLPQIRTNHPPLSVDYLIVRGNPSFSLTKLRYYYSAGTLVFDGSNSYSKCNRWMQECLKIKQKAWNTRESGAMIVDL
jgi:hypothetical protein